MGANLLHEYVSLMIESIRSKKGVNSKMGSRFDLKKFKSLDNIHMMLNYAEQFLDPLGEGSSREAFALTSRHVLKVALNEKGLAQNQAELDVFTNPKTKGVVAQIYQSDDQDRWLIVDLVKPVKQEDEFAQLTGTDWASFRATLKKGLKGEEVWPDKFTQAALNVAKANNLMFGDLGEMDHWGKTSDGRVVLLDYGFTRGVRDAHYNDGKKPEKTSAGPKNGGDLDWGDVQADLDHPKTKSPGRGTPTDKDDVKTAAPPNRKKAVGAEDDVDPDRTRR